MNMPDPGVKDKPDPHKAVFTAFIEEFIAESDRACVVLGCAKIDALLCSLLDRYFLPHPGSEDDLLEGDSPLSTFSSRIKICFRLGLIDQHFAKLLHILRRLRNAFAHEISQCTLATGAARDRVLALAEPFAKSDLYQYLLEATAKAIGRPIDDAGVIFRSVLAIYYLHIVKLHGSIRPTESLDFPGIVELAAKAKRPS